MTDFRALCAELVDELEDWIAYGDDGDCADAHAVVDRARAALRPKPPSLKEQALEILRKHVDRGYLTDESSADADTIRRALEQLDD
jgi:transposase